MKNLLKILSFVTTVAASLLTAGCGNELDERNLGESPSSFTASIEQEGATKTLMGVKYTSGSTTYRPVEWVTGDQIAISGASANYTAGTLTNNDRTATFTGSGAQMEGGLYKAYYPATIYNKTSKKTSFPATQTYGGLSGSKTIIGDLPMYAASSTTSLTFRNLCAVLNFRLKGESTQKVTEIVVTSSNQNLWGEFTIGGTAESPTVTMNTATGGRAVTLNCGAGVALSPTDEKDFFIAIPAQTYGAGSLTIQIKDGATTLATLTNSSATAAQTTFSRNQIYEIGKDTQPVDPNAYTLSLSKTLVGANYSGGVDDFAVTSYKTVGGTNVGVKCKMEYSTDNGVTWNELTTASRPLWLSLDRYSVTPSGAAPQAVTTTFSPQTESSTTLTQNQRTAALRNTPEVSDFDLSLFNPATGRMTATRNTANCYVVSAPGTYKFPLVYGNALKNGVENSSAYTQTSPTDSRILPRFYDGYSEITSPYIWQRYANTTTLVAETLWMDVPDLVINPTISGTGQNAYISFTVPKDKIAQGNAVIAVRRTSYAEAIWSWHIWVTDEDLSLTSAIMNGFQCSHVNLGWVDDGTTTVNYPARGCRLRVVQDESGKIMEIAVHQRRGLNNLGAGNNLSYVFGKKDPYHAYDANTRFTRVYYQGSAPFASVPIANESNNYHTPTGGTRFPWILPTYDNIHNAEDNGDGWAYPYINLWNTRSGLNPTENVSSTTKTVYDPCPVGFKVPPPAAFKGLTTTNFPWRNGTPPGAGRVYNGLYFPAIQRLTGVTGLWYHNGGTASTAPQLWQRGAYLTAVSYETTGEYEGYVWAMGLSVWDTAVSTGMFNPLGSGNKQRYYRKGGYSIRPVKE